MPAPLMPHPPSLTLSRLVLLAVALYGCTSGLKATTTADAARIELGKSTKSEVLAALGLPHARETKTKDGAVLEMWIYYKGFHTSSLFIPVGVVGSVVFLADIPIAHQRRMAAAVVFDSKGVVVDVIRGVE